MNNNKNILTASQASEANFCHGNKLTAESLIINRLAATVAYLYKELDRRDLELDRDIIAAAINYELDYVSIDNCLYAADSVIESIRRCRE
jgi:hypothetical protein